MTDLSIRICPYCESKGELYFTAGKKIFFRCSFCDLIFRITEQDEEDRLLNYYRKNYFTDLAGDQVIGKRDEVFTHTLDMIESQTERGKLLDVGCGCGLLLKEALGRGWAVCGVDPSEQSVEYASSLLGDVVYLGTLEKFYPGEQYDVITMVNVLDHMTQPWQELKKIYALLKPGGYIFFRFPNGKLHSLLLKISKKYNIENCVGRFLIFHEHSLTPRFIKRLLSDHNFVDIDVRNAKPTAGNWMSSNFKKLIYYGAEMFSLFSDKKILMGTSLSVMAKKPEL